MDVEGLGIVFLEASSTGLPVVAGDSGGAPDAVTDDVTGVVVDGTDRNQLVDRVSELLTDTERAKSMGVAGRAWVEQAWQWDAIAARLAEFLEL
jgi:phosphatidylinositol alpha-1,6-mannosyltransferase